MELSQQFVRGCSCVFDPQRSADNTSPVILSPLHRASLTRKNSQGPRIILKACADQSKKSFLKNALFVFMISFGGGSGGGGWAQLNLTDG